MPDKQKKGWTKVAFGDVVKLSRERSRDPLSDGLERYLGLEHLDPEDLKIRRWGNVADGTTFTSVFRAGQVLFGKRRAYQKKLAVPDFDGVCSGDIYVLEPRNEHLLPELLPFICQTDSFFDHAVGTSAGSLSPRTNWKSLAEYEFALPPLDEQRRIAEVLGHFEEMESSIDYIKRTARLAIQSLAKSHFNIKNSYCKLSNHYDLVSGQVDPRKIEYRDLPLIAPNHIESRTGRLLKIETAKEQSAISGKYFFDKGSVLYSKIRPNLVKATIVKFEGLCSADMYVLTPRSSLKAEYLLCILLSDRFTEFATSGSNRTGIPKINRKHLQRFTCHVPEISIQDNFVKMWQNIQDGIINSLKYQELLCQVKRIAIEGISP